MPQYEKGKNPFLLDPSPLWDCFLYRGLIYAQALGDYTQLLQIYPRLISTIKFAWREGAGDQSPAGRCYPWVAICPSGNSSLDKGDGEKVVLLLFCDLAYHLGICITREGRQSEINRRTAFCGGEESLMQNFLCMGCVRLQKMKKAIVFMLF